MYVTLTAKFSAPFSSSPCKKHDRNGTVTQTAEKLGEKSAESPFRHPSAPSAPFEINTTVTQPQPQGEKGAEKKGCRTDLPEPINPEPNQPPVPVVNPEKTEVKPMPVVNPETTEAKPMQASEEYVQKIVRLVLGYLEDFWSRKKIPGELVRQYVAKISGRYENAVWELLFPAHVVKLHTTDFFILRDDKHRPKGYEGLLDDKGVLPIDEPALF